MARPLTPQEQAIARQAWPKINAAAVVVTDEPTGRYNCLAWTLGISTSWIWPWGTTTVAKAEFDTLYQSYGFAPTSSGPIAVFGLSSSAMTHGSVSGVGHGPRWESKCGTWLRIQHGLTEMEGGTFYGNVLGFYSIPQADTPIIEEARVSLRTMKAKKLSRAELKYLKDRVRQVDPAIRARFEAAYAAWKEAWDHPLIAISSNPASRTQTPRFLELLSLGPEILPLLMEKLTNPEEFFALQAVDRLLRPEFVIRRNADDPAVLLGEQGRAIETIKQWVRTEA